VACLEVLVAGDACNEGEGVVVRQGRNIALVGVLLIGCAVLLVAGASGVQAQASNKEETRCEGTQKTNVNLPVRFTTNDLPGCPKGGLLLGTDKVDELAGEKGDDEVRGLGGSDDIMGGDGNDVLYGGSGRDGVGGYDGDDVIYGGPGNDGNGGVLVAGHGGDDVIYGGPGDDGNLVGFGGKDVIYGGPGDDTELDVASAAEFGNDGQRDKLYCGEGRDTYYAEKIDYVDSSCEVRIANSAPGPDPLPICTKSFSGDVCRMPGRTSSASASGFPAMRSLVTGGGPDLLLPAAALLFGSGILTYAILRRR
jgi:Ca2+-binding RTX toxin-like protein